MMNANLESSSNRSWLYLLDRVGAREISTPQHTSVICRSPYHPSGETFRNLSMHFANIGKERGATLTRRGLTMAWMAHLDLLKYDVASPKTLIGTFLRLGPWVRVQVHYTVPRSSRVTAYLSNILSRMMVDSIRQYIQNRSTIGRSMYWLHFILGT